MNTKNFTLNEWAAVIHQNAVEHGWWDEDRSFAEVVALCHSELSEALEEDRAGRPNLYCAACGSPEEADAAMCAECNGVGKPEGKAIEMLDCVIRILDWCGKEGIDVDRLLAIKHNYNITRPYKHGKRF